MKRILFLCFCCLLMAGCNTPESKKETVQSEIPATDSALIERGKYLVGITGCHHCHSPKLLTDKGPEPDPARMLSGQPALDVLAPYDSVTAKSWILLNQNFSAFKGPWGVSFAANLTPDETGLKDWTFERFSNAFRKGFFRGMEGGRKLLPPMPWQDFATMTDEDTHAIFAYLQSLPPIKNRVPDAVFAQ